MTDQRQQTETEHDQPMQEQERSKEAVGDNGGPAGQKEERAPLLASGDAEGFRHRWEDLQAGFVDRPREVVEQANELVGELMQQLSAEFSEKRGELEAQWEKGEDVSTEDLRVALTRYRSFFNRLLSA